MSSPNVSIKSNVYLIESEKPFSDKKFLSQVVEIKALEKMNGKYTFNEIQNKIWKRNMYCSVHPERSRTFGVIKKDGRFFEVTKCDHLTQCKYAERCGCHNITEIDYE